MQSDDPPFLAVGTEVSAKFKGAFCEAKIKKIVKSVKCKVLLKQPPFGSVTVEDTNIRGKLELNQQVEIMQSKQLHSGIVQYIKDCSSYTVVFNDGDERVLRRTQVCLKGGKHFDAAANLDTMPLYHPESFVNSMLGRDSKKKRKIPANSDNESDSEVMSMQQSYSKCSPPASLRRSVRSASVTPLKGIASTRSITRAIAALKGEASPVRGGTRASSVLASTPLRRGAHNRGANQDDSSDSVSNSEDETGRASDDSNEEPAPVLEDAEMKEKEDSFSKQKSLCTELVHKSSCGSTAKKKRRGSSPIASSSGSNVTTTALKISSTRDSREVVCSSATAKETIKKPSPVLEQGKTSAVVSNVTDDKKFPPLTVVVINEFAPPRTGGRMQLGLVVSVKEYKSQMPFHKPALPVLLKGYIPFRSFQNGRYHVANINHLSLFDPVEFCKLTDNTSTSCIKIAFERANLYFTKKELPQSWEKKVQPSVTGALNVDSKKDKEKAEKDKEKVEKTKKQTKKRSASSSEDETSSSEDDQDEDYNERRDRFVAHFYKFQDESGNPMNRVPVLGGREIDLYRFYDVVNQMGGHKRVTLESRWRKVLSKLHLEECAGATPLTVKNAYLRYFKRFEAFMKHLGYSTLNGAGPSSSSSFSRSMRMNRNNALSTETSSSVADWKKAKLAAAEKRKHEKHLKEKTDGGSVSSANSSGAGGVEEKSQVVGPAATDPKDSTSSSKEDESSPPPKILKMNQDIESEDFPTPSSTIPAEVKATVKTEPHASASEDKLTVLPKDAGVLSESISSSHSNVALKPECFANTSKGESREKVNPKHVSSEMKQKIKREDKTSLNERQGHHISGVGNSMSEKREKKVSKVSLMKRRGGDSDNNAMTSSDEEAIKRMHRRRGSMGKEDRVKSPLGHQAVEEQDVGYSNANIFTRFYQGQKVHARHHLRFYDARVITVRQPSLLDICKSLVNAFKLGKITHPSTADLETINLNNMGMELKDALKNMVNATKCFVHYLGWNSRYDEWLLLHKIRVDEKDEKASVKALEALIPAELPPRLFAVAMDWCTSAEGIPALAHTHAYASDQQRPRRLSSSKSAVSSGASPSLTCSSSSTSGSGGGGDGNSSTTTAVAHFQSSQARHHHTFPSKYSTAKSHGKPKNFCPSPCSTSAQLSMTVPSSTTFSYNSPLSGGQKPITAGGSNESLSTISGQASPKSSSLYRSTSSFINQQPVLSTAVKNSHSLPSSSAPFDVLLGKTATTSAATTSHSLVKFTIPHLHQKSSSISASINQQQQSSPLPPSVVYHQRPSHSTQASTAMSLSPSLPTLSSGLMETVSALTALQQPQTNLSFPVQSSAAYVSSSNVASVVGDFASTSDVCCTTDSDEAKDAETIDRVTPIMLTSCNSESSAVIDDKSIITSGGSVVPYSVVVIPTATMSNKQNSETTSFYNNLDSSTSQLAAEKFASHEVNMTSEFMFERHPSSAEENFIFAAPNNVGFAFNVVSSDGSRQPLGEFLNNAAASATDEWMKSPLTTVSSCGAVEDFDDTSSLNRQTETPLNDDDECTSTASNEAKSITSFSLAKALGSPPRYLNARSGGVVRGRNTSGHTFSFSAKHALHLSRGGSKSPHASATVGIDECRTLRGLRRRFSKSPDGDDATSSGGEDTYEEHEKHSDSSHAVRMRVVQRMESDHLFSSYSFLGLPELGISQKERDREATRNVDVGEGAVVAADETDAICVGSANPSLTDGIGSADGDAEEAPIEELQS